ncbi:MAG: hypothetical protein R3Y13_04620 [bacterium]
MNQSHFKYIEKFNELETYDKESVLFEHIKELTDYLTKVNSLDEFSIDCEDFHDKALIHLLYIKELNANLIRNIDAN